MLERVKGIIEEIRDELISLSEYIYNNPELGCEEVESSRAHVELLRKNGFKVEEKFIGIDTAFKAEYKSDKEGPTIAYLAEYDALPEIGHGCGHNILGTTSTGAGITLSRLIDELGGKVVVIGTPAEETDGAKVDMVNKGVFDDIDIVMLAHPASEHRKSGKSLAIEPIQFVFRGKSAHAAASPEKGVNALDAVIGTFNSINALREHIRSDARIHGVIKEGGKAANIVPDFALAQFYIRATTKEYLNELVEKVNNCARGAALATGTTLEISNHENGYDNMITNQTLSEMYSAKLLDLGVDEIEEPGENYGSSDAGNVSQVCPTIHPYFKISDSIITSHTKEFAEATLTQTAYNEMCKTIGALVLTAVDIIEDKSKLDLIRKEFNEGIA